MYEKLVYRCPNCHADVRKDLQDEDDFVCRVCSKRFRVLLDVDTGKAGFIELSTREVPEPLYLPKGSIRALVTMIVAATSWVLILTAQDVPEYLFSLLLTVIGYYFGIRTKLKAAESRIFDASTKEPEPLSLPTGFIRLFLTVGFLVCGVVLYRRELLGEAKYLEFFIILSGLIVGYVYARLFSKSEASPAYILLNHVKGVVVLAAAGCLAFLFIGGAHAAYGPLALVLSAAISFYFGSRS